MRKRFWVGLITCLFATFSVLTLVAISAEECKQGVCAGAWVKGSSEKKVKARVSSTRSYDGRWTYRLVVANRDTRDQALYWKGYSRTWTDEEYTATASAYASNHARHRSTGKTYYSSASESSGG